MLLALANDALAAAPARAWYGSLLHPAYAIPSWMFRPVWSALYPLAGLAAWLVWKRAGPGSRAALRLWGWALLAAALHAIALFGARNLEAAAVMAVVCAVLLAAIAREFLKRSRIAGWLMVPSLLWTGYLMFLGVGLLQLNPG